jgi:hypothetical protein
MKIEIISVRNPVWTNSEKTSINCLIKTNHLKEEVPFTASLFDSEEHGIKLFNELISGKYGEILEFPNSKKIFNSQDNVQFIVDDNTKELLTFLEIANKDLTSNSPRNLIILWSAKLEYTLRKYLDENDVFLEKKYPTLKDYIKKMRKNSFFDEKDYICAENIRKIRNIAAHQWNFNLDTKDDEENSVLYYIKELYNIEHKLVFEEIFDDLDFMVKMFFSSSCARLIMKFIK